MVEDVLVVEEKEEVRLALDESEKPDYGDSDATFTVPGWDDKDNPTGGSFGGCDFEGGEDTNCLLVVVELGPINLQHVEGVLKLDLGGCREL